VLSFDSGYYAMPDGQSAKVEISTDGGRSWTRIWHQEASNAIGHITIPVPAAAGKPGVRVRFRYTGTDSWYWAIDNIFLGTRTCVPQTGGLLTGTVTDHATGQPVNGAQITGTASPQPQPWPTGISQATSDPAHPGGIYWLFSPSGSQQFTATAPGYATAAATATVTTGQVTRQDWTLTPAGG
jgi:Carboxypeptidase regulatory-like domain